MPKFISELDPNDPNDAEEMRRHVFGFNYQKDAKGNPIDQSALSDWSLRNGRTPHDRIEQHLAALANPLYGGSKEKRDEELARIRALQRQGGQPEYKG